MKKRSKRYKKITRIIKEKRIKNLEQIIKEIKKIWSKICGVY